MIEKIEKKRLAILRILNNASEPVSSGSINQQLENMGFDISERTVRFHLLAMDNVGLTEYIGKKGRRITEEGRRELLKARVYEKVGFLTAKIDQMTYRMDFNLEKLEGDVIVNVSYVKTDELKKNFSLVQKVFNKGYAMGSLMTLFHSGEQIGDSYIPEGYTGVGTVCSITLNGVLLAHGIPVKSRFGGILEIEDNKPTRFVAIINYDGTSLDPLEIFIKSGMTDYLGATETGSGLIGASFREIPSASRDRVIELADKLDKVGLGGFMDVGWAGQPLLEIPVNEGISGAIVIGGLNPMAILVEKGCDVHSKALSGLVSYKRLFHYSELKDHIKQDI